jgi:hypothetical protein
MSLSRYARLDAYTFTELRREYSGLGAEGRVRLLERLNEGHELPREVAQLAVEDQNVSVRQWAARHLDLSDEQAERLRAEGDEFMRACLWENPEVALFDLRVSSVERWVDCFNGATHLERLAMMRNPSGFRQEFIEMIFDPEDSKLPIDLEERRQLVFALLSNNSVVEADQKDSVRNQEFFAKLWMLAGKWPRRWVRQHGEASGDLAVPYTVYRNVPIDRETKRRVLARCEEPSLREAINDLPERGDPGGGTRVRKALSYGSTAENAIEVLIAFLLLRSATGRSEEILYSVLVILYLTVRQIGGTLGHSMLEQHRLQAQRHIRLLELFRDSQLTKAAREAYAAEAEEQKQAEVKLLIWLACSSLMWAGAAFYLVRALWN